MAADKAKALGNCRLELPADAARRLGLSRGARLDLVVRRGKVELLPDIHSLARVYIEPTTRCNLACRTCVQRNWGEPAGDMSRKTFDKALAGLKKFPHLRSAMLGGFGEPTVHPDIIRMVAGLKSLGIETEMVSNGTLLERGLSGALAKAGLDRLWVSFDGADTGGYESVREGGKFRAVLENVKKLAAGGEVKIGLAFVATRRNIGDLPKLGDLAREAGADRVSVSNVIPYTAEMEKQMVCGQALSRGSMASLKGRVDVDLPRLDVSAETRDALMKIFSGCENLSLMGEPFAAGAEECRFVRERCVFVRYDGAVAPCMSLLHSHEIHFRGGVRSNKAHAFGELRTEGLEKIWNSAAYRDFREKVSAFDFSPCHVCGPCGYAESNAEDCGGSRHPAACGGCLWGRGVIQCP